MSVGIPLNSLPVVQWKNATNNTIYETKLSYFGNKVNIKVSSEGTVWINPLSTIRLQAIDNTQLVNLKKIKGITVYKIEEKNASKLFDISYVINQNTFRLTPPRIEKFPENYAFVLEGEVNWISQNLKVGFPPFDDSKNFESKPNQSDHDGQPSKKIKVDKGTNNPIYGNVNNHATTTDNISTLSLNNSQELSMQSLLQQESSKQETSSPVETQPVSQPSDLTLLEHFFLGSVPTSPSVQQQPDSLSFEESYLNYFPFFDCEK